MMKTPLKKAAAPNGVTLVEAFERPSHREQDHQTQQPRGGPVGVLDDAAPLGGVGDNFPLQDGQWLPHPAPCPSAWTNTPHRITARVKTSVTAQKRLCALWVVAICGFRVPALWAACRPVVRRAAPSDMAPALGFSTAEWDMVLIASVSVTKGYVKRRIRA